MEPADVSVITVIHRAMLDDAARLAATVARASHADRPGRLAAVARWYGGYLTELHDHHTVEDEIMFPLMAERVPEFADAVGRLSEDHHHLDAVLTRTRDAVNALTSPAGTAAGFAAEQEEAVAAARSLRALLEVHLGFENSYVLPLYSRHFSQEENEAIEAQARKSMSPRNLPFTIPWVIEAATDDERERLLGSVPLPFKLVWFASRRRYRRLAARAFPGVHHPSFGVVADQTRLEEVA